MDTTIFLRPACDGLAFTYSPSRYFALKSRSFVQGLQEASVPTHMFRNSHWAETRTSAEPRPTLNLPEPSEEERLGKDIELTAWFLPNAKCKCSFFSWQRVQGFFVKVSYVSSPTQVKKLCSGICARPPGILDKTWNRDYKHRSTILSPFCKAFFFNDYSNAKYHAPCGHNGNLNLQLRLFLYNTYVLEYLTGRYRRENLSWVPCWTKSEMRSQHKSKNLQLGFFFFFFLQMYVVEYLSERQKQSLFWVSCWTK